MSVNDLAPDPSRGLEVKQPPPVSGAPAGASPAGDPGAGDDAGTGGPSDRSELNRASEARKLARKAMERVEGLAASLEEQRRINQQLLNQIVSPAQPAVPQTPPHSTEAMVTLLQGGNHEAYHQAMQENLEWQRRQDQEAISRETDQKLTQHDQRQKLQSTLMSDLGLGASNDVTKAIDRVATEIQAEFPNLDRATAIVWASARVYRQAATGEAEFEDLREESVSRTIGAGGAPIGATQPDTTRIDWDAPNRGLPSDVVKRFHAMGLGRVLTRSADPSQEADFQHVVNDVIPQLQAAERRRAMGVQL